MSENHQLGEEMLDLNEFSSVSLIAESYFSVRGSYFKKPREFQAPAESFEEVISD